MKNIALALALLAGLSMASPASAQHVMAAPAAPVYQSAAPVYHSAPIVQSAPVVTSSPAVVRRSSSRRGLFSGLIELERRKNAWLRRTFLGR